MTQRPNGQFQEEGSLNSEQRGRGQKAAVFILPQSIYSLLPESYLPLTLNLFNIRFGHKSPVYDPCYHWSVWSMRIHERRQAFSAFILWLAGGSTGTGRSIAITPELMSLGQLGLTSVPHGSACDPLLTGGMKLVEEIFSPKTRVTELLWLFRHRLEKKGTQQDGWAEKERTGDSPAADAVNPAAPGLSKASVQAERASPFAV